MSSRLIVRLTAPLVGVSLLLLASGVMAAWYVHYLQRTVAAGLLGNISSMRAAEEVEILIRESRTQLDSFLITSDVRSLQKSLSQRDEIARWLRIAQRHSVTPEEKRLTDQASKGFQRYLAEMEILTGSSDPDHLSNRLRTVIKDVLVEEVLVPIHQYLDFNEVEVEVSVRLNQTLASWLVFAFLGLGICGSVAGLLAGFAMARRIKQSLVQLSIPIRAAAGQLDTIVGPVTLDPGHDLHHLQEVLNRLAERTSEVVERLRQSEREILRSEQLAAVGQMAAGVAHELRNPLTSMKLLVQSAILRESRNKSSAVLEGRDLRVLQEEIQRLETLTQTFLQFARPPLPEKRQVHLQPFIRDTLALVAPRAQLCQIRLEEQMPDEPIEAWIDPAQIRQMLLNLLLNGFDAVADVKNPTRPVNGVVLSLEQIDQEVRLAIHDSGCGLPVRMETDIFAPFVTTKESGLGLGLSICKRIVEAHGGSIHCVNGLTGGAVFTVLLPTSKPIP